MSQEQNSKKNGRAIAYFEVLCREHFSGAPHLPSAKRVQYFLPPRLRGAAELHLDPYPIEAPLMRGVGS